jgi:SAM-dependent methyltransferase
MNTTPRGSIILPSYMSGSYYETHADPDQDSPFKVKALMDLLAPVAADRAICINSFADVGCGGGGAAQQITRELRAAGHPVTRAAGYDIAPHIRTLQHPDVNYYMEDFCACDDHYSLVTLFDVIEHVPNPVGFLRDVAERADFVALHIPLDNRLVNTIFDRFHHRLRYPGHVTIFDTVSAINMVTQSGITPLDYSYTHGYAAPSGTMSAAQRIAYPFRYAVSHLSPWLASRTVGGVSLMVIGATRTGLQQMTF